MARDERDHDFKTVVLRKDAGPIEASICEIGFQRLNQSAFFFGLEVVLQRLRPGGRRQPCQRALLTALEIED